MVFLVSLDDGAVALTPPGLPLSGEERSVTFRWLNSPLTRGAGVNERHPETP